MGLFSGIKDAVKSVTSSFTGDGLLTAGLGILGGTLANSATAASTKKQMEFQERMRDTQYQAAVRDLKKAGLNPRLAYQNGGAAAPAGASYSARDVSEGGREGLRLSAEVRNMRAQTANILAQNENLKAQEIQSISSAKAADATAQKLMAETRGVNYDNISKKIDAEWAEKFGVTGKGTSAVTGTAKAAADVMRHPFRTMKQSGSKILKHWFKKK